MAVDKRSKDTPVDIVIELESCDTTPAFRAAVIDGFELERTRLSGEYDLPTMDARKPSEALGWNWLTQEDAAKKILENGQSCYISGIAGTGKSFFMKSLVSELEKTKQVKIIAKCHVATLNAGVGLKHGTALTAQSYVHKYNPFGGFTKGVLILEEIMTLDTGILHQISSRKKMDVQVIILGDPNQFGAIGDSFNGMPCNEESVISRGGSDRENNNWIKTMCDFNRVHLTEAKRCKPDDKLFMFYSALARPTIGFNEGGDYYDLELEEQIKMARAMFPMKCRTQWNLTVSHRTRKRINKEYNDLDAMYHDDKKWLPKSERASPNDPQGYWLFRGLILISYIEAGRNNDMFNGELFEVIDFNDKHVIVQDIESYTKLELTIENVKHNPRIAYEFTNIGCQGRSLGNFETLDIPERGVTIWDTKSRYFTEKHLFTGMSRCRSGGLLQVQ